MACPSYNEKRGCRPLFSWFYKWCQYKNHSMIHNISVSQRIQFYRFDVFCFIFLWYEHFKNSILSVNFELFIKNIPFLNFRNFLTLGILLCEKTGMKFQSLYRYHTSYFLIESRFLEKERTPRCSRYLAWHLPDNWVGYIQISNMLEQIIHLPNRFQVAWCLKQLTWNLS